MALEMKQQNSVDEVNPHMKLQSEAQSRSASRGIEYRVHDVVIQYPCW